MKRIIWHVVMLLLPVVAVAQEESAAEQGNVLDDIVVQENLDVEFEEQKLPINLEIEFSDIVQINERVNWDSVDEIEGLDSGSGNDDVELRLSHPELASIHPAPVKIFNAQFKDLRHWKLELTAADGTVFRTIEGEGNPPEKIAWDGLSGSGQPLVAGRNYAFSFTAVDKAGNKRTFPGQTFTIPAFYLQQGDGLLIGLDQGKIFSKDRLRLTANGAAYAREVASLIRYFSKKGKITVTSQEANIDDFLQLVAKELVAGDDLFVRTHTGKGSANSLTISVE